MPRFVIGKISDALNNRSKPIKGSKILVLGAAYKPDIDDIRESPALDVIGLLIQKGAEVSYHDPYIKKVHHEEWELQSIPNLDEGLQNADCVVILTNHSVYDYASILEKSTLIIDSRNALGVLGRDHPKVVRL